MPPPQVFASCFECGILHDLKQSCCFDLDSECQHHVLMAEEQNKVKEEIRASLRSMHERTT